MALSDRAEWLRLKLDEVAQWPVSERQAKEVQRVDQVYARLIARLAEPEFAGAKQLRQDYLDSLSSVILSRRGRLVGILRRFVAALRAAELDDWREFSERFAAHPHMESHQDRMTVHVEANGESSLPVRVALKEAVAPAINVRVVLDQFQEPESSANLLPIEKPGPGETRTVWVRMIDRRRQGAGSDVRVRAHLNYVGPNNETLSSAHQKLTVELRARAAFQEIPNPFRDYAAGHARRRPEYVLWA